MLLILILMVIWLFRLLLLIFSLTIFQLHFLEFFLQIQHV